MADGVIHLLENEVDNKSNFVFTAGAGSGKTYSLIKTLEYANELYGKEMSLKNQKIACITYTNAGVSEIESRLPNIENINVSTIHQFLWSIVKHYQKDLKKELKLYFLEKIEKYEDSYNRARTDKTKKENLDRYNKFRDLYDDFDSVCKDVTYQDKSSYKNNIISHDVVIKLSLRVLEKKEDYLSLISNIYPIILIDEYQDTFKEITDLFIRLSKYSQIGFFGDPMQKIYDRGVGEIPKSNDFNKINSEYNRRSYVQIINLLNNIRRDDIVQIPTHRQDGDVKFIYSNNKDIDINSLLNIDKEGYKEFQLLHRRIAEKKGFLNLFNLINKKYEIDVLVNNEENRCISILIDMVLDFEKHFIEPYKSNKNITLKKNYRKFDINPICFDDVFNLRENSTFITYCEYIYSNGYFIIDLATYEKSYSEEVEYFIDDDLSDIQTQEYINCLEQVNSDDIITCHSTKGKEYKKVIAFLNEGDWNNKYKWSSYFQDLSLTSSQYINTSNLFYVICSRAIEELIIVYIDENNSLYDFSRIEKWFESDNIYKV